MRQNVTSLLSAAAFTACGAAAIAGGFNSGPDVIAGSITGPAYYGTVNGISAYSIGTESCNIGDTDLLWIDSGANPTRHPVISQNMYRLKDGRFEQLGQSWLKHGFFAINDGGLCFPSNQCNPSSLGGDALGPGCNDPYSAGLNGQQGGLGAKFEVNPATGAFPWPFTGDGTSSSDLRNKRIQVRADDLNPALNAGALYFGEGHYVTPDDAAAGNDNNNASHRRIVVGSASQGGFNVSFTGSTMRGEPAIFAWQANQPTVTLIPVDIANDGRLWIGYDVTDNGDGTFNYEYAIQNLNSDIAVGGVDIPVGAGAGVSGIGFNDVDYHSGEPYDNTDWSVSEGASSVAWNSPQTFAQNPNTNALRWGTTYSFWFTSDSAPTAGDMTMTLFKTGQQLTFPVMVPSAGDCPADVNGDGNADPADFTAWLGCFNNPASAPYCDRADVNGSGTIDPSDFTAWLAAFNAGCN